MNTPPIHMVDVVGQYKKIKPEIDAAIQRVMESGQYILGKEVTAFEQEMAAYLSVRHAVGCASGTDALQIALMALGVGPGDEVVTTPFTFAATTEVIVLLGARPVYVDIDPRTFNIRPDQIEAVLTPHTKAIIPVHLYGQAADMDPLMALAKRRGIPVVEDMCQAVGADYKGVKVGGIGSIGCISFFPSKNLGAFGDAGMVVTNDPALAEKLRMIAAHGSRVRYTHEVLGVNSRLDALQAAMLRVKLRSLEEWIGARRQAAATYDRLFAGTGVTVPLVASTGRHVFHQYTIRVKHRDSIAARLAERKIPHAIYYPIPLHLQPAYRTAGPQPGPLPGTDIAAAEVLSLPMHTELDIQQQTVIANAVLEAL